MSLSTRCGVSLLRPTSTLPIAPTRTKTLQLLRGSLSARSIRYNFYSPSFQSVTALYCYNISRVSTDRHPSSWSDKSLRRGFHCKHDLIVCNRTAANRVFCTFSSRQAQRPSQGDNGPAPDSDRPSSTLTNKIHDKTKDLTAQVKSSLTPHENIYNVPNFLTATRLVAAPVIGYLIVQGDLKWALGLFVYAGVTDLVDGWMARKFHLQTVVGSVIDPMADKLLMTVMTISLAVKGLLPAYLATLILGRDVALAVAAIYYRYASLPAPKTMKRYWDFSLPSAEVHPTTVSKYNTFLQLVLIGATLALPVVAAEPLLTQALHDSGLTMRSVDSGITYFQWLVAATTAWSGLSYAVLKNAVRILGNDEALKIKQGRTGRRIIGTVFGSIVLAALVLAVRGDESVAKTAPEENERADSRSKVQ